MKTTTYSILITAIALASMTGNGYLMKRIVDKHNANTAILEKCSEQINVHACKFVVTAVEAPKIIYKTADLLPPPVNM